jgi:Spy/CpxP family protein refolding chaperone
MNVSGKLTTAVMTLAAIATMGTLEVTHAQSVADPAAISTATPRARPVRQFIRAIRQLQLSDDQKQQIKSLLGAARTAARSEPRPDLSVLANPSDPNYAAALQAAKDRAAVVVQRWSDLQLQIYNVLTPEQKAQLPQVLSNLQARAYQRNASPAS